MAFLWRLNRELISNNSDGADTAWPAAAVVLITLQPADFFGSTEASQVLTTINGSAEFEINGATGRLRIKSTTPLPEVDVSASFPSGSLSLVGNTLRLDAQLTSIEHLQSTVNWITDRLTLFLSAHAGIYFEIASLEVELAGRMLTAMYPAESYSVAFAQVTVDERSKAIHAALLGPNQDQKSYARYVAACHYFQQALMLISPRKIDFVPYTVHSEVLLNLCKSIEALVSPTSREDLRDKLRLLGFTDQQVESQIVPIVLIRNEIDVGHSALNPAVRSEIATLRKFVDRSIQNVAAILRKVGVRIASGDDILQPLQEQAIDERSKFVKKLSKYLEDPPLSSGFNPPQIITMR